MNPDLTTDIFSKLRHALSNEDLGTLAMTGRAWSPHELGKLVRIGMDALDSVEAGDITEVTKAFSIGEDFYENFTKFARRKLSRLAAKYNINSEVLRAAIKADDNFEIIKGDETAIEYIRLAEKLR